jgi:hypothetical protein
VMPRVISRGRAMSIAEVSAKVDPSGHGALDPVEGAVWRVERDGRFDFIAKWVRQDKVDGRYLSQPVWNWRPDWWKSMNAFESIAAWASILGFFTSLGAFWQANRASRAAREARQSIHIKTVAEELEVASVRADQVLEYVRNGQLTEAGMRANDLVSLLSEVPYRRGPLLGAARDALLEQRWQMSIVAKEALSGPTENRDRLLEICQKTRTVLREILGIIKSQVDSGV